MCQFECSSFCTHWTTVVIPEHSPLSSCFRNGQGEGTIPSATGELHLQTDSASPLTHSKGGTSTGPRLRALGSEPLESDSLRGPFPTRMWSQLPWPGFSQGGCSWKALPLPSHTSSRKYPFLSPTQELRIYMLLCAPAFPQFLSVDTG